jgi:hypothetical protein
MNELFSPDHRSSGNGWADELTAYLQRARGSSRGNLLIGCSLPLWVIDEDACRSTKSMDPSSTTTNAMMTVNGQHGATGGVVENEPATGCRVVRVPPKLAPSR